MDWKAYDSGDHTATVEIDGDAYVVDEDTLLTDFIEWLMGHGTWAQTEPVAHEVIRIMDPGNAA